MIRAEDPVAQRAGGCSEGEQEMISDWQNFVRMRSGRTDMTFDEYRAFREEMGE